MSKARERQNKRRQRQAMVSKGSLPSSQIARPDKIKLPEIHIPGIRWIVLGIIGVIATVGVIFLLALINPPESESPPNAIWLNADWAHQSHSESDIEQLTNDLRDHQIGVVYLFSSSLLADNTWSGVANELNRFSEVESGIQNTVAALKNGGLEVYAWIEVNAVTPSYRLAEEDVQTSVAEFSKRMVERLDFDGVLLDVKPIFEENEDYIQLLRNVRREIGFETQLLVAVPPDLTPSGTQLNLPDVIAPGTEWTPEYKQRVALLANQIVIGAYNSYHTDPIDYIEWVTYQVDSYIEALSERESDTSIIVSVPLYETKLPAHDAEVETLTAALDGARRGVANLNDLTRPLFAGVAIYTDRTLTGEDWAIFDSKWRG